MVFHAAARPLLATLPEYPSLGESVAFQLNGLIVVFLALGSIWGLLELMGIFFRRQKTPTPAPLAVTVQPADTAPSGITPELTAVIAAAVSTSLKRPHRIHSIAAEPAPSDWAHEGRREIFGSHRIR